MWALRMENKRPGIKPYLVHEHGYPVVFRTRQQARDYANKRFAKYKRGSYLRDWPHLWRMPRPVKVKVVVDDGA